MKFNKNILVVSQIIAEVVLLIAKGKNKTETATVTAQQFNIPFDEILKIIAKYYK